MRTLKYAPFGQYSWLLAVLQFCPTWIERWVLRNHNDLSSTLQPHGLHWNELTGAYKEPKEASQELNRTKIIRVHRINTLTLITKLELLWRPFKRHQSEKSGGKNNVEKNKKKKPPSIIKPHQDDQSITPGHTISLGPDTEQTKQGSSQDISQWTSFHPCRRDDREPSHRGSSVQVQSFEIPKYAQSNIRQSGT